MIEVSDVDGMTKTLLMLMTLQVLTLGSRIGLELRRYEKRYN